MQLWMSPALRKEIELNDRGFYRDLSRAELQQQACRGLRQLDVPNSEYYRRSTVVLLRNLFSLSLFFSICVQILLSWYVA